MGMQELGAQRVGMGVGGQGAGHSALDVFRAMLEGPQRQVQAQAMPPTVPIDSKQLVDSMMLDRRASALYQQAVDGWLTTGMAEPFEPPVPLPPDQQLEFDRRLAVLAAQRSPRISFPDAPAFAAVQVGSPSPIPVLSGEPASRKILKAWADRGSAGSRRRSNSTSLRRSQSGPGSRGGHVIGTTRSGKPIYGSGHESYAAGRAALEDAGSTGEEMDAGIHHMHAAHPSYTVADHLEASEAHGAQAARAGRGDPHRLHSLRLSTAHAETAMALSARRSVGKSRGSAHDLLLSHLNRCEQTC